MPDAVALLRWTASLALGAAGAGAAMLLGLPLPFMLGPLFAVGAAVVAGMRIVGEPLAFPAPLRLVFVPVIGVLIGAAFTPEALAAIPSWWPTLASVILFVPLAHGLGFLVLRRLGGYDLPTACFAATPGGLIESIEMGSRYGADMRALTTIQFARIALVVTAAPVAFSLAEGRAVGSAAGMEFARGALSPGEAALLIGCGAVGFFAGRAIRLPAGQITGPLLLSAAAHGLGWTDAAPPLWLVSLAQIVIGTTLGLRFVGLRGRELLRHMGFAALNVALALGLGLVFGVAAQAAGGGSAPLMLLSLAPGGVVEMGLIALSLQASPIFVTAHHIARILLTVTLATLGWRWIGKNKVY